MFLSKVSSKLRINGLKEPKRESFLMRKLNYFNNVSASTLLIKSFINNGLNIW